jgi:hypothetical protein
MLAVSATAVAVANANSLVAPAGALLLRCDILFSSQATHLFLNAYKIRPSFHPVNSNNDDFLADAD